MMNVFDDIEKNVLYEAIRECSADYAKNSGDDEQSEDVVLMNKFIEGVTRFDLVELIVNKLNNMGYKISKKS